MHGHTHVHTRTYTTSVSTEMSTTTYDNSFHSVPLSPGSPVGSEIRCTPVYVSIRSPYSLVSHFVPLCKGRRGRSGVNTLLHLLEGAHVVPTRFRTYGSCRPPTIRPLHYEPLGLDRYPVYSVGGREVDFHYLTLDLRPNPSSPSFLATLRPK